MQHWRSDSFSEAASQDQELWEVIVAPDDIKLLTLEQLDDAFRLDVIGVSTLVRQRGTASWQRLGVVAGIESESTGGATSDWDEGRPEPPRTAEPHAAPLAAHPFWSAGGAVAPLPVLEAPEQNETAVPAPAFGRASFDAPAPVQPLVVTRLPKRGGQRTRSRLSSWLIAGTTLLGALWSCHRNDLLLDLARRFGREPSYLELERAVLGGPGAGTPRALAAELGEPAGASERPPSSGTERPTPPTETSSAEPRPAATPESSAAKSSQAVSLDALPLLPEEPSARTGGAAAKPVSASAPAENAAPKSASGTRAEKVTLDEAPTRSDKPEDPLKAAIRSAIEKQNRQK
jgi:hypothetical protein